MGIRDWLFPKICLGCGVEGRYVCSLCLNKLTTIKEPVCPQCNRPSHDGKTHGQCRKRFGMDGLTSVLEYKGLGEKLITAYKYKWVETLTEELVEIMISLGDGGEYTRKEQIVVAVPLHLNRQRWRGFNQAEELAQGVAHYFHWGYQPEVLMRVKKTQVQMKLERKERLRNMEGAFMPGKKAELIHGKAVLLVDDVWTTGATMRECAKTLKHAGAIGVWGLTLARA